MTPHDAIDHQGDAGRFRTLVFLLTQIDVVYDLRDGAQRRVLPLRTQRQERLKRAHITRVRELAFEHVEAHLAWRMCVTRRIDEDEHGVGIAEAPDQPCRGHPVDFDAAAGPPRATAKLREVRVYCWFLSRVQCTIDSVHESLHFLASGRSEEHT